MYKSFYAGMEDVALPITALLFFLAAFTWVVAHVARRREHQADWDQAARLPLHDDLSTFKEHAP